ncbi:MAG: hypothetical protein J6X44_02185 [Thermoguttaceae bacterium]|nr:hypothetical protein [Thermoguttaceae bacterium]
MTKINPELVDAGELPLHIIKGVVGGVYKHLYSNYGLPRGYDKNDLYQTLFMFALETKLDSTFKKSRQVAYLEKSIKWKAWQSLYDLSRPSTQQRFLCPVPFSSFENTDSFVKDKRVIKQAEDSERRALVERIFQFAETRLPEQTIRAFKSVYLDGKRCTQVAREMGVCNERVRQRLRQFIEAVQKAFEGEGSCF